MKHQVLLFLVFNSLLLSTTQAINPPTNAAPTDGVTNQPTSITIDWLAVTGNAGYIYEIDTTPNFNSTLYQTGTTATNVSQAAISDLYFGTTYYWRAATIGAIDTSVWGSIWSFSTEDAATNVAPTNGATNEGTTLNIDWLGATGNLGYIYEVDTTSDFNSTWYVSGATTTNTSQFTLSDLYFGTTYYWRVAIKNGVDTSNWGPTWSFTTLDEASNTAPANTSANQPTSLNIDWAAMTGNTGYLYQVDVTPNFNSPFYMSGTTVQNSSQAALSNLRFGTTYYWRAAVKNNVDTSGWGPTWSFTTLDNILNFSPNNNSYNEPTTTLLDWSAMTGNIGYLYEIDTTPDFNSPLYNDGTTATNSSQVNVSDLYFGTTYYWRAAVKNSVDTSGWSSIYNFTTTDAVVHVTPANAAIGVTINPTLDWTAMTGNTGYMYRIDTSTSFNSPLLQIGTSATNTSQTGISNLLYGTTYYWSVAIKNNVDTSGWTNPTYFTTAYQLTVAPLLVSPLDETMNLPLTPLQLVWDSIVGVTHYHIQYSTDSTFMSNVYSNTATQLDIMTASLNNNTRYFWRVRGGDALGYSPWSVVWAFNTEDVNSSISKVSTTEFQVFPNPVEDLLTIQMDYPQDCTLRILDAKGQLLVEQKYIMTNKIECNTTGLISGVYFVQLESLEGVQTKIVIKK